MHEQRSSTEWTNYWRTKKSKSRELCARVPLSNKTTSLSPKKSLLQISSLPYTWHTCKFGYWATRAVGTFGLFPGLCQWGPFLCHTPVYAQPSCDSLQCAYTTNQEKVKIANDAQLPIALACGIFWYVALVPCIKTHHVSHLKLSRALTKTELSSGKEKSSNTGSSP